MIDPKDLHAFVDGELSSEQVASIQKAIDTSSADARELETIRAIKAMLRNKTELPASGESWKLCVKRLDELDKTKKIESTVSRFAPYLCAGLFVIVLIAGPVNRFVHRGSMSSPDLAPMLGSLAPIQAPKGISGATPRWTEELIRQSFFSTPDHLIIRGVSSGEMDGVPVRRVAARDQNGDLSILVISEVLNIDEMTSMDGYAGLKVGKLQNMNCVLRNLGGKTIIVVADRPFVDLAEVASRVTLR